MALQRYDVVIIGAGISGLATAYYLLKNSGGNPLKIALLEKSDRPGGLIHTTRTDGFLAEAGPNSFMNYPDTPAILELCQELGIQDKLTAANPISKNRYVYRGHELHPVPFSPKAFLKSRLLSGTGKLRILMEPFIGRGNYQDESLADLIVRRFGEEVLDYLVDPMVTGIYAGMAEEMSAKSTFPRLVELEKKYGSIIRGLVLRLYKTRSVTTPTTLYSFQEGMATLPLAIASALESETNRDQVATFYGCEVTSLEQATERSTAAVGSKVKSYFAIQCQQRGENSTLFADRVVVAAEPYAAARFAKNLHANMSQCLEAFLFAGLASLTLGFRTDQLGRALDGFGFLVPRREPLRLLGSIWSSSLFPNRAPEGHVAITCMVGGLRDHEILSWKDDRIFQQVLADLHKTLGLQGEPVFGTLHRYNRAIPQYPIGHALRIERLRNFERIIPGLYFTGNYIDGVSVSYCVERARRLASLIRK